MKRTGNKNLKIIAATSMAIFSLFSLFMGTMAWFTAKRSQDLGGDDPFGVEKVGTSVKSIEFHSYLGEVTQVVDAVTHKYFAFTPTATSTINFVDGEPSDPSASVALGEYSLENPHHPLLVVFEVSGVMERIEFETDYCFLGNPSVTSTVTKATHAAMIADKASYSDGQIIQVSVDEEHNDINTFYEYHLDDDEFEMVSMSLKENTPYPNYPLSSAVNIYNFKLHLNRNIQDESANRNITYMDEFGVTRVRENTSCYIMDEAGFTSSNMTAFADFTDEDNFEYSNSIVAFNDNVDGYTHVALVIDYNSYAIEYICSQYLGHPAMNYGLDFLCDWKTKV